MNTELKEKRERQTPKMDMGNPTHKVLHRKIMITVETVCKCGDMYMHHKQILLTPHNKVPLADCVPMRSSQEPINESSAKDWIKFNRSLQKDSVMRVSRRNYRRHRGIPPVAR